MRIQSINLRTTAALFVVSIVAVSAVLGQTKGPADAAAGFHRLGQIEVGGEGGWDYLCADAVSHRLYVSHATKVVVIDTEKDSVVGEIPNTNGVHGIAIADDLGKGFISDGRDNLITIFDVKTLKTLDTVAVGKNPDAILYDASTRRVFTFNGVSKDSTVLDAETGKVIGTFALGGKPEFAQADGKGTVFVNIENTSEVVAFDAKTLKILHRWPIAPGEEASGMAIDRKNNRLFIVCDNKKMIVLDSKSGKVLADLPIGADADAASFDPGTNLAFSSNGDGTVTVVRAESGKKFNVIGTIPTRRGSRTMTLDPATHKLYLPAADFGQTPAATADRPRPRPSIVPGSFVILVYGQN